MPSNAAPAAEGACACAFAAASKPKSPTAHNHPMFFCMPLPSYFAGSDRRFGMHVEEVQPRRVQRETQTVVDLGANVRLDGSDHRVRSGRYIQQDLRAELLDDFDDDVEA